jgi:hypothetical protein
MRKGQGTFLLSIISYWTKVFYFPIFSEKNMDSGRCFQVERISGCFFPKRPSGQNLHPQAHQPFLEVLESSDQWRFDGVTQKGKWMHFGFA